MTEYGRGMMIVLSSPSGAGKTTLTKLLSKENSSFEISISCTTRIPRQNEIEGKDYFFISKNEFQKLIDSNSFLEHAKVFNNYYGTKKDPIIKKLSEGKKILFDIDWQGTEQIKKQSLNYKLLTFFILPPSTEELKKRLAKRDIKDKSIVNQRMLQFKKDIIHWKDYDYVYVNNDLNECRNEIMNTILLETEGKKNHFDKKKIENKIKELIN